MRILYSCRNEQYQEDLWKRSFEFLKDHLSAETIEKYGPRPEEEGNGGEEVGDNAAVRPEEGETVSATTE